MSLLSFALVLSLPNPAPQDALVVAWAGLDALVVDERDAGLAGALQLLDERLLELGEDLGGRGLPVEPLFLARQLARGKLCLRVGVGEQGPTLQLCAARSSQDDARELAEQLAHALGSTRLALRAGDGRWTGRCPLGEVVLDVSGTTVRLALGGTREESFQFASQLPPGVEPALFARFDGRQLGRALGPWREVMGDDGPAAWRVLEALGVVGPNATPCQWALGFTPDCGMTLARVEGWAPAARARGAWNGELLERADFARVPADATLASLGVCRPVAWLGLLDVAEPGTSARLLAGVQGALDIDLRTGLLEQLGPAAGVYASRTTGGGGLLSTVAFVEVADERVVADTLARLLGAARPLMTGPARGRVDVRAWRAGEVACQSVVFPGLPVPLELSFAVDGGAAWFALDRNALTAALGQRASERCLLDHPALADVPESYLRDPVGFAFLDVRANLVAGYGPASLLSAAVANFLRSPRDPEREPRPLLPLLSELAGGARSCVSVRRVQGDDLVGVTVFDRSWTVNATALAGTPLAHSYLGLMGASVAASVAIPRLMVARVEANEQAALASLRAISSAQALFQAAGLVDCDRDGEGEYGFFGELTGARPVRVPAPTGSAWGRAGADEISPPVLAPSLGQVLDDGRGGGVVQRSGYCFQIFLPGTAQGRATPGLAEPATGRAVRVDADRAERAFACYAWPIEAGKTGRRTFFVDQAGELLQCAPGAKPYSGTFARGGSQPSFDAAFASPGDLLAPLAPTAGGRGCDGNRWTPAD